MLHTWGRCWVFLNEDQYFKFFLRAIVGQIVMNDETQNNDYSLKYVPMNEISFKNLGRNLKPRPRVSHKVCIIASLPPAIPLIDFLAIWLLFNALLLSRDYLLFACTAVTVGNAQRRKIAPRNSRTFFESEANNWVLKGVLFSLVKLMFILWHASHCGNVIEKSFLLFFSEIFLYEIDSGTNQF